MRKAYLVVLFISLFALAGCGYLFNNELIVNRYADVLLTKNNELQFRFRINNELLDGHKLYKVRIIIRDDELAAAIGKREIVYGEDQVINGEYLDVHKKGEKFIFMNPIPLEKDLHIHQLRTLIEKEHAVSVEVFNDKEVIGQSYITNFSSEL